jgi:hypothetical protein
MDVIVADGMSGDKTREIIRQTIADCRLPIANFKPEETEPSEIPPPGCSLPGGILNTGQAIRHPPSAIRMIDNPALARQAIDKLRLWEHPFSGVGHPLWVEPSTRYRLRFFYKAEKLPEVNGLAVRLTDAEVPARFSLESAPLERNTDWRSQEMDFETPAGTRLLRLQILRKPVGMIYDYISGRVWFDSFSLEASPSREPLE